MDPPGGTTVARHRPDGARVRIVDRVPVRRAGEHGVVEPGNPPRNLAVCRIGNDQRGARVALRPHHDAIGAECHDRQLGRLARGEKFHGVLSRSVGDDAADAARNGRSQYRPVSQREDAGDAIGLGQRHPVEPTRRRGPGQDLHRAIVLIEVETPILPHVDRVCRRGDRQQGPLAVGAIARNRPDRQFVAERLGNEDRLAVYRQPHRRDGPTSHVG
jgi:hypothetical protein